MQTPARNKLQMAYSDFAVQDRLSDFSAQRIELRYAGLSRGHFDGMIGMD
jgi:hypothetical protein